MTAFALKQLINGDGTYTLDETIVYESPRYGKTVTVPKGYRSDGATGAMDITSRGWWVHDMLCDRGTWDDSTKLSNWQCSQVLQDILASEGRKWQGHRWFWATWIFGGGKARKNGLLRVASMLLMTVFLTSCASWGNRESRVVLPNGDTYRIYAQYDGAILYRNGDVSISIDNRGRPTMIEQAITAPMLGITGIAQGLLTNSAKEAVVK